MNFIQYVLTIAKDGGVKCLSRLKCI
uniref:Uncharacterized protein n=1 Tax=Anguilla anguilla TaxID=7936 RepID=A0A0E9VBY5_ANGAN